MNLARRRKERRKEAIERAIVRENRSDIEQLTRLDQMFGEGKGAQCERTRLLKRIEKNNEKKQ